MRNTAEWIKKSQQGDNLALSELVEENSGLIWSVARRFAGRGTDLEDLYQLGCVGFLKAVQGFNFQFGTQFSTYAVPKIAGEIRRFLRDDGTLKVSRGIKEQAYIVHMAREELTAKLGRSPTVQEISEKTGISAEEIATAEIATSSVESFQMPAGEDGFTLENILTDTESEENMLEKISLRQAINKLPSREKMTIELRYYHGLTQQQTSEVLKVSQVQVSRIEKKAIEILRSFLG